MEKDPADEALRPLSGAKGKDGPPDPDLPSDLISHARNFSFCATWCQSHWLTATELEEERQALTARGEYGRIQAAADRCLKYQLLRDDFWPGLRTSGFKLLNAARTLDLRCEAITNLLKTYDDPKHLPDVCGVRPSEHNQSPDFGPAIVEAKAIGFEAEIRETPRGACEAKPDAVKPNASVINAEIADLTDLLIPLMSEIRAQANPRFKVVMVSDSPEVKQREFAKHREWFNRIGELSDQALEHLELLLEKAGPGSGFASREWINRNTTSHGQEYNPLDDVLIGNVIEELVAIGRVARDRLMHWGTADVETRVHEFERKVRRSEVPKFLSIVDCAKEFGISKKGFDAFEGRVRRLHKKYRHDSTFATELANRAMNEPKWLYCVERVRQCADRQIST